MRYLYVAILVCSAAVVSILGGASTASGGETSGSGSRVQADAGSLVEDFAYPGADKLLADRGIALIKGDGHILLVDCSPGGAGQVVLSSSAFADPICFKVTGAVGYLSMSIPEVYSIKGDDHAAIATVSVAGSAPRDTEIKKNLWTPINAGDGATLLELKTSA
ncbi:hypothetical protein [Amycolatopsis sp. BJA-103]|uniref:hypothetical protein n=1 Tax=Amycolatopsis sp. BJA-103 TaxID=1911175 RepID=UPI0011AF9983|nr:hypothetical protein [Amycolatopsis sp. BJA-103]